jgi:hypothetical protein
MKFTLATCVRNEGPYLLECVAHYKRLGFDRIVIFSNDNDDGSDELLSAMQDIGLIEWRPRKLAPGESPQLSAFKAYSRELFENTEELNGYLAWFDCDEFLALKSHASIQELIEYFQYPDSLFINWKHFGSSSLESYQTELTISRFLQCDSDTQHNKFGKSISRIAPRLFSFISNHRPIPLTDEIDARIIYATNQAEDVRLDKAVIYGKHPKTLSSTPIFHDLCQLNHYAIRSKEEYQWKSIRGNGRQALDSEKVHFKNSYFTIHDLNKEIDILANEKYASAINAFISDLPVDLQNLNNKILTTLISRYRSMPHKNLTHTNESWLTEAAAQNRLQGYSIEAIEKRLAYGSFVGDQLDYVFMETPKAACSTMKWVISALENRQVQQKQIGQESNPEMVIHMRSSHKIKSLMQLSSAERLRMLTQTDLVRFCVVRNPYARLVSAWADKIRQKEPGFASVWESVANFTGSDPTQCPNFADFAHWVVKTQDPRTCNPHWRSMVNLLLPELINYNYVLHTENLVDELQIILSQIAPHHDAKSLLKQFRTNESLPIEWQTQYDEKTAELVAGHYKYDFERYGYALSSWQKKTRSSHLADECQQLRDNLDRYEKAALAAIRHRNEVIVELIKFKQFKHAKVEKKTPIASDRKKTVLVLGDSHVNLFKLARWQKATPAFDWQITEVVGATLSGLQNPRSKTQAGNILKKALTEQTAEVIVLCLGEVDTGFVIWFRSERDGIDIRQSAQRAIENYCSLIKECSSKAKVVVLSAPLPTLLDGSLISSIAQDRSSVKASQMERTELTCWFNNQIETWCKQQDIHYVNLDNGSKGQDGLVSESLRHPDPKNHHYNPKHYQKLLLENLMPVIKKLTRNT